MSDRDLPAPGPGGSRTILVVDDVDTAREVTCRLLNDAGYRVLDAACAAQALEILASARRGVDLVLTDVVMPEISGVELAHRLHKRWPGIRYLFMSAYGSDVLKSEGLERPTAILLAKPFSQDELLDKVTAALRQGPADPVDAAHWPFPARRVREPRVAHERRLRLLREIKEGADSVRRSASPEGDAQVRAKLTEWEELEALRDIKVRVIWGTDSDRPRVIAAFAVITPSGEKLLEEPRYGLMPA
jgi:CheY-like chemotaxis protein